MDETRLEEGLHPSNQIPKNDQISPRVLNPAPNSDSVIIVAIV